MSSEWINEKNGESNSVVIHWSSSLWRMSSISILSLTLEIVRASRRGDGAKEEKGGASANGENLYGTTGPG